MTNTGAFLWAMIFVLLIIGLLRKGGAAGEEVARELARIGRWRADQVRERAERLRIELERKLRKLEAPDTVPSPPEGRRIDEIRSTLAALDPFVRHILGIEP